MRAQMIVLTACVAFASHAAPALAAVDVTRDAATGAIRVTGDVAADAVSITRVGDEIQISGAQRSSDDSCGLATTAAICDARSAATVLVDLGDGSDQFDSTGATGISVTVNGGAGADTLRVGASGMTRITDATATDTIDMAHADGELVVRYETAFARLVARCGGCSTPFAVTMPAAPGRVLLGPGADDVELARWPGSGLTRWILGAERDRFFGAVVRRSVVDAGDGWDTLVSRTAVDVLRGGAGFDKLADFGGAGDVLQGGAETDAIASLDSRRDTIDGQGGKDLCLTAGSTQRSCDTGPVRSIETAQYLPAATQTSVLAALGIR